MTVGVETRVQARIGENPGTPPTLTTTGTSISSTLPITPTMRLWLDGDPEVFDITPSEWQERVLAQGTVWEWIVKPKRAGEHELRLYARAVVKSDDPSVQPYEQPYDVLQQTVTVSINPGYTASRFLAENQLWVAGVVASVLAAAWRGRGWLGRHLPHGSPRQHRPRSRARTTGPTEA